MIIIGVTSWNETGSPTKDVKEISRDRLQLGFQIDFASVNMKSILETSIRNPFQSRRVSHEFLQSNLLVHDNIAE